MRLYFSIQHQIMKVFFVCLIAFAFCFQLSCMKINLTERHAFIPEQAWKYSFVPEFQFDITDTIHAHKIFIVVKHLNDYDYQNLWLNVGVLAPQDTIHSNRVNVILSTNERGWLGSGFANIYERRFEWHRLRFTKMGKHTFRVQQIMRDNPLPHIISVGIRIEK